METKQTAVEWLVEKLDQNFDYVADTIIQQAKEMEKQQIIDAHGIKSKKGFHQGIDFYEITTAEEYYNKTFGEIGGQVGGQ
jgi:hypothetical protein